MKQQHLYLPIVNMVKLLSLMLQVNVNLLVRCEN